MVIFIVCTIEYFNAPSQYIELIVFIWSIKLMSRYPLAMENRFPTPLSDVVVTVDVG